MLKDLCFEVIQTCPNNCKFCSSNSSINAKNIIPIDVFKKTVEHFLDNGGIGEISISGGEPFLHPDLFEMVRFCKENNIRTVIFTSGIKRSEKLSEEEISALIKECSSSIEEIERYEPWNERSKEGIKRFYERMIQGTDFSPISNGEFQMLKSLGLDKIVFDYQAAEEETYNMLMGTRSLMTDVITSMIRARMDGLKVDVHFIPMKSNYREFKDILECLDIAGIENISLLNFVPQGRGKQNKDILMLSDDEMREFSEIFQEARKNYKGRIRVGIPLLGDVSHSCTAGTEKLDIKYDGTVLPCPAFKEIDEEILRAYGITLYNIYEDLESINVPGGKRDHPLCREIYKFSSSLRPQGGCDR